VSGRLSQAALRDQDAEGPKRTKPAGRDLPELAVIRTGHPVEATGGR